jgi:hypothetical protein
MNIFYNILECNGDKWINLMCEVLKTFETPVQMLKVNFDEFLAKMPGFTHEVLMCYTGN